MQNVITAKKLEVYTNLIDLFTDFTDPKVQRQVKQNPKKQEELGRRITVIGIQISLLGAPDVVKKYVEWRLLAQGGGDPDPIVDCFSAIILAMREDLVEGSSAGLTQDDILTSFLTMDDSELKDKTATTRTSAEIHRTMFNEDNDSRRGARFHTP